ncbi:MAG: GDSL-type esterase/lipase family protein [Cyanobium sp.]
MSVILKALSMVLGKGAREAWVRKHEEFCSLAALGEADVLLLGDSITEGWRTGAGRNAWEKEFGTYRTANFGISGDRTHQIHWRLENGEMGSLHPKLVILLAGTNNLACKESKEMIVESMELIINALQAMSPAATILLLGILPRGRRGSRIRHQVLDVNGALENLSNDRGLTFLDCGHRFLLEEGTIPKELMPDKLHLSSSGYEVLADALRGVVHASMNGEG